MKWLHLPALLCSLAAIGCAALPKDQVEAARAKWGKEVDKLKAKDAEERHPDDAVLFIGSSSIRLWESIERDMAPYHPIQRGYGGAKYSDLVVFAEELITPHRFRAMVVFVGNDVTGKETDATPRQVADWFERIAKTARRHQPDADVFCLAVTPTPSRWKAWDKIQEVNAALKQVCDSDERLHFIPTTQAYLNEKGEPRAEYFRADRLHQNEKGYAVWAGLIKQALRPVLGR